MTTTPIRTVELTGYERLMAVALAPITVSCSTCKVTRGHHCRSRTGYTVGFHKPRREAVAGWSEDERIAAVVQLRDEEAEHRAATSRALGRLRADPVRSSALARAHAVAAGALAAIDRQVAADERARTREAQAVADRFNAAAPVGTYVRYWRGVRQGPPSGFGRVYHPATVLGGHSAVAWISGCSGCVGLSHVEPLDRAALVQETAAALVVAL